jgi:hypothetical protein
MIIFQKRIYRSDLRQNPGVYYVFGDNAARCGLGGQAAEMRGEPNAIGVATKWSPSECFSQERHDEQVEILNADLDRVAALLKRGLLVVWPSDGIGTGLAELERLWPRGLKIIGEWLELWT